MRTCSPTFSELLPLFIRVDPLIEDMGEQTIPKEAKVFAHPTATAFEEATRRPVVERGLGHLEQSCGLIHRQDGWIALSPPRIDEGGGDLLRGQAQPCVLASHREEIRKTLSPLRISVPFVAADAIGGASCSHLGGEKRTIFLNRVCPPLA